MRPRPSDHTRTRWLPLEQVAPIPAQVRFGAAHPADPAAVARAELAATVVAYAPAVAARPRWRASAISWRGTTVAALALVMVACAAAGLVELRARGDLDRRPLAAVAVPGTGLVVDKPAGWTEGPIEAAPTVLSSLVDVSGGGSQGLFFTTAGGRALFVVAAPNSAGLDAVPPVPDHIGAAVVSAQATSAHPLGPARSVQAESGDAARPFGFDATYVLTEGRIVVVGAFSDGGLDPAAAAAAAALVASMRPR